MTSKGPFQPILFRKSRSCNSRRLFARVWALEFSLGAESVARTAAGKPGIHCHSKIIVVSIAPVTR